MLHIHTQTGGISLYAVMIVLSFVLGISGVYVLNVRRGIRKNAAGYLLLLSPLCSLTLAMLQSTLESGGGTVGFSSVGGLAGMYASVLIMALIVNRPGCGRIMAENVTLMLPLMYAVSKIGCLMAGCCRGFAYDGWCSIRYTGRVQACAFPVQAAESLVFLCIFGIGLCCFLRNRKHTFPLIFLASAAAKFLLDYLREAHQGKVLTVNQILCAILFAAGIVWLHTARRFQLTPAE